MFCGFCAHQADQIDIKASDIGDLIDNCDSDAVNYHQGKSTGNSFKQVFIAFPWARETSYLLIPWIRSYDYLHHALLKFKLGFIYLTKEIMKLHKELVKEDNWLTTNNPEQKYSPWLSLVVAIENKIIESNVAVIPTIASKNKM